MFSLYNILLSFSAACIALAVPDLNDLIALIGAVASSSLALIFPSLLAILVFWRRRSETYWLGCLPWPIWMVKDLLIALLGMVGTVFGTYAAISSIVHFFALCQLNHNCS